VEEAELDGVDTERARSGTASSANEGVTLGDGELGRCSGVVTALKGGVGLVSAILNQCLCLSGSDHEKILNECGTRSLGLKERRHEDLHT
jgi:hypothetical protein